MPRRTIGGTNRIGSTGLRVGVALQVAVAATAVAVADRTTITTASAAVRPQHGQVALQIPNFDAPVAGPARRQQMALPRMPVDAGGVARVRARQFGHGPLRQAAVVDNERSRPRHGRKDVVVKGTPANVAHGFAFGAKGGGADPLKGGTLLLFLGAAQGARRTDAAGPRQTKKCLEFGIGCLYWCLLLLLLLL